MPHINATMNFDVSWHVDFMMLSADRIETVISLINNYSLASGESWVLHASHGLNREKEFLHPSHLERVFLKGGVFSSPEKEGVLWRGILYKKFISNPDGVGGREEIFSIHFDPEYTNPEKINWVRIRCCFLVDSLHSKGLFVGLMNIFSPHFCWFLPEYPGPWGGAKLYMEAALERDFSYGGCLDPRAHRHQITLAKSLAAVLPRMSSGYYDPKSNGSLLLPQRLGRLGWLNYWSAEVAEHLGFPDPQKDADLLPLCRQLPSGHWVVQLTEDPLDLTRPDHVEAIVRAYWRFDKIGRRAKPAAKKKTTGKSKPAPVDPASLRTYLIHERDDSDNWWQSDYPPIEAASEEDALRIYFCKLSRSRMPRPHETTNRLRKAYDAIALEVGGMPRGEDVEARLKE